jgi:hypothetical protein
MTTEMSVRNRDLRETAIKQLRKKREFWQHAFVYLVVNAVINLIWLFTTPGGFYWPMFPLFGWGIGLVFHAFDAFGRQPSERSIEREMNRLARR